MAIVQQKQKLAEGVYALRIKAPAIAKQLVPGQYVALRKNSNSPPIHLFPAVNESGSLSFIITDDGPGSDLATLKKGEEVENMVGPLGKPFAINEYGNVVLVADGDGVGPTFFLGKALKNRGNRVYLIARLKSKKAKFWESKMSSCFDKWFMVVKKDDVQDPLLREVNSILRRKHVKLMLAFCDPQLMGTLAHATLLRSSLYCSLLPFVTDAPSLCTECRVTLGGDTKLACIDGPLFNAHRINWDEVMTRHYQPLSPKTTHDTH